MYRVTVLKNGVRTDDVEEFSDEASVIQAMKVAAPKEYVDTLKDWFRQGANEPLTIQESSVYTDFWEYLP